MAPVRIKLYGLFRMTRQTYVALQAVGFAVLFLLLLVGAGWMLTAGELLPRLETHPAGGADATGWLVRQTVGCLFWLGLFTLLAEAVETRIVLRKFDRAEALELEKEAVAAAAAEAQPGPAGGSEAITPGSPGGAGHP